MKTITIFHMGKAYNLVIDRQGKNISRTPKSTSDPPYNIQSLAGGRLPRTPD